MIQILVGISVSQIIAYYFIKRMGRTSESSEHRNIKVREILSTDYQ